jgi:hypothetical protein
LAENGFVEPSSKQIVGIDNICFETDYPHTDTTWPHSEAYVEKMIADAGLDDETAYKVLARQRDTHARARPHVTGRPPGADCQRVTFARGSRPGRLQARR